MTMVAAATNEPLWLKIARGASVTIPDADIPPPGYSYIDGQWQFVGDAPSALWVGDVLRAAIGQGADIPDPGESIGELAMYGRQIDPGKQVPQIGSLVLVTKPNMWVPASPNSKSARLPNNAKAHAGFLVRSTIGNVYVLGEGVIRCFPRVAVGSYRSPA